MRAQVLGWYFCGLMIWGGALEGCRTALPSPQPEKEFTKSAGDATFAAERAATAAEQCKSELSRSEQLLSEMRVLASRARDAELRCEASRQAIAKKAKTPVIRRRGTPKKAPEVIVAPPPAEPPKPVEPEYSPSDAPIPPMVGGATSSTLGSAAVGAKGVESKASVNSLPAAATEHSDTPAVH